MKYILGNSIKAVVLSFFLTTWFMGSSVIDSFSLNVSDEAIESMDVDVEFRKILLNVHLKRETTCEKIIQYLDIQTVTIKDRHYSPSCSKITDELIIITYDEIFDV